MPDSATSSGPIVHFLYEPGDGGLDRVAILLANGMAARGIATELWLTMRDGPLAALISDQVTVRIVPTPAMGGRGLRLLLQIPAVARMIRDHAPQAIFSAGNQSNLTIALARKLAGKRAGSHGTRIIQKITNPVIRPGMGAVSGWLRSRRFGLTARMGDLCLTLSEADARNNARLMPDAANRFRAVHNAYVTQAMLALGENPKVRAAGKPVRLLSVGRLAYQKDHATILRALGRLKDCDWTLRMLGGGPLQSELQAQAEQLGIEDRISFEGFVANPATAFAQSDILLLSSRWEGFPAVPLEAMAAGCDVVATDCSEGLSELLAMVGNKTVVIGDDAAFAAAIRTAIQAAAPMPGIHKIAAQYSIEASVADHLRMIEPI